MKERDRIWARIVHRVHGRLDASLMTFGSQRRFFVSTLVMAGAVVLPIYLEIIGAVLSRHPWAVWAILGGLLLLVAGKTQWDYRRMERQYYAIPNPWRKEEAVRALALPQQMRENGYLCREFYNGVSAERYVASAPVNRRLQEGWEVGLRTLGRQYQVGREMTDLVPGILRDAFAQKQRVFFNGQKLRLAQELYLDRGFVSLQKTHYYDSQCTNEIVYKKFRCVDQMFYCFDGLDLLGESQDGRRVLWDLDSSPCSNQIGVSTLAVTSDNWLAIGRQGFGSRSNPGRYAPSGSGSADFGDIRHCTTLNQVLVRGMERELTEEMNLPVSRTGGRVLLPLSTALLGYVRLIERGGAPDFFGVTRIGAAKEELARRKTRKLEQDLQERYLFLPFRRPGDIPGVLRDFCAEHLADRRISIQLEAVTVFLEEMREEGRLEAYLRGLGLSDGPGGGPPAGEEDPAPGLAWEETGEPIPG